MKKTIIVLLLVVLLFSSCTPKIDKDKNYALELEKLQYTKDNPYVIEDAEIDDDMSRLPFFDENVYRWYYNAREDKSLYATPDGVMSFRVKKEHSKSYCWSDNGTLYFITISSLKVLEKLKGNDSDYYNSVQEGDILNVQEYYSFYPDGSLLAAVKNTKNFEKYQNSPYNKYPYDILKNTWYGFLRKYQAQSYQNIIPLTYHRGEWDSIANPLMKFDTEYIIQLHQDNIMNSEDSKLYITTGDGKQLVDFPRELIQNTFINSLMVIELSESAYNNALKTLEKYDSKEEFYDKNYSKNEDFYYGCVIPAWELYGDRVGT